VDETRGLVVAMAYYDIPGTVRSVGNHLGRGVALPARLGRPHTLALWQVFRIQDGAIHHIEGLARVMPYGARPYPRN
jgi:hypothetical protein